MRKRLTPARGAQGVPAASTPPSESATPRQGAGSRPTSVTVQARNMGLAMLGAATFLAVAAIIAGTAWTAPAPGICSPPGGGQSVPCPAGELTANNLFSLIALVVASSVLFAVGIVVEFMVWLRAHPAD